MAAQYQIHPALGSKEMALAKEGRPIVANVELRQPNDRISGHILVGDEIGESVGCVAGFRRRCLR